MKQDVVILGNDLFAEVVHCYFTNMSEFAVVAFTANQEYISGDKFLDLPLVPFEEIESLYPPDRYKMFIAVGYANLNRTRARLYTEAKEKGYELVSYVHPGVKLWPNNEIGDNTFIFEDNTIQPFVKIGSDTVLWSGNHVGHHSTIGDHCFVTSHVVISGNCQVGDYCFIGVNATLRDTISVGKACIIGPEALIMKSTGDNEVYTIERTKPREITSDKVKM